MTDNYLIVDGKKMKILSSLNDNGWFFIGVSPDGKELKVPANSKNVIEVISDVDFKK